MNNRMNIAMKIECGCKNSHEYQLRRDDRTGELFIGSNVIVDKFSCNTHVDGSIEIQCNNCNSIQYIYM